MRTLLLLAVGAALASVALFSQPAPAAAAPPAGSLVGQVLDTHRQPVAGAIVEIALETRGGRTFTARTQTDRRGHFEFARLPESRGVVRAAKRGVGRDRDRILIRWGQTTRERLVLH